MSEDSIAAKNLLADRRCENCFFWNGEKLKHWCDKRKTSPLQMTCAEWKELDSEERLISQASDELKKSIDHMVGEVFSQALKEKLDETSLKTAKTEFSLKQIQDLLGQTLSEIQEKYGNLGKYK